MLKRLALAARARLTRWWDPAVRCPHLGVQLLLPLSHDGPLYVSRHPHYDRLLPRLAQEVASRERRALVIDVGANVGDSAAVILAGTEARVLCVEGDARFAAYLCTNLAPWTGRWDLAETLVGDRERWLDATVVRTAGTARLAADPLARSRVRLTTLDELLERYPLYAAASLLKIDTDGFDGAVLAGARKLLTRRAPVLFFEYDPARWRTLGGYEETIFPILGAAGYRQAIVYANTGELVGEVGLSDETRLRELGSGPSGAQNAEYFDLLLFPARQSDLEARFLDGERARFGVPSRAGATGA